MGTYFEQVVTVSWVGSLEMHTSTTNNIGRWCRIQIIYTLKTENSIFPHPGLQWITTPKPSLITISSNNCKWGKNELFRPSGRRCLGSSILLCSSSVVSVYTDIPNFYQSIWINKKNEISLVTVRFGYFWQKEHIWLTPSCQIRKSQENHLTFGEDECLYQERSFYFAFRSHKRHFLVGLCWFIYKKLKCSTQVESAV